MHLSGPVSIDIIHGYFPHIINVCNVVSLVGQL